MPVTFNKSVRYTILTTLETDFFRYMKFLKLVTVLLFLLLPFSSFAVLVKGRVTDQKGMPLGFATVYVKGTTQGTVSNNEGYYQLDLAAGNYTIVCQFMGYEKHSQAVTVVQEKLLVNFTLLPQNMKLKEVTVNSGGEDPAYAIIRKAIAKRETYLNEVAAQEADVYIKGVLKLLALPEKVMFMKINLTAEDSAELGNGIMYLCESITHIAEQQPGKYKEDVLSARESGNSNGFGFNSPSMVKVNFYENLMRVANVHPRGIVSPISESALHYYKYKLEGSFYEDGQLINKILVTPKRKFEPLFQGGYINIVENSWRIHSVNMILTSESQISYIDTLRIEQVHVPVTTDKWRVKNQVFHMKASIMGISFGGDFVSVYSNYNLQPSFGKNYFDATMLSYQTGANKKSINYWDSIRPVPLNVEEKDDYVKKDSLEKHRSSPAYLDSMDRLINKFDVSSVIAGDHFYYRKSKFGFNTPGIFQMVNFNSVEGINIRLPLYFSKKYGDVPNNNYNELSFAPQARYGISNTHLQTKGTVAYTHNRGRFFKLKFSGGRWVYQYYNENPVNELYNLYYTLVQKNNYLKLYEAWFAKASGEVQIARGLQAGAEVSWQDRRSLDNTNDFSFAKKDKELSPNYPTDLLQQPMQSHQALLGTLSLSFNPGQKIIRYPNRNVYIPSKWPVFTLAYTKGIYGIAGSDVDYDKWKLTIKDNIKLRLLGNSSYQVSVGGFLNRNKVFVPDYTHFYGNQFALAIPYLTGFQLAPYYKYSNTESFYATLNFEHHFDGLLTNKIPGIRKLNWQLVAGTNAFYVNSKNNYAEVFAGIENIAGVLRIDGIAGYQGLTGKPQVGIRIGFSMNGGVSFNSGGNVED